MFKMMFSNIFNYKVLILISLLLFSLNSLQADHRPPVDDVAPGRIPLDVDGHGLEIPYFGNRSLADINDNVNRAVVVIHGASRKAGGAFRNTLNSAEEAGADQATFILAPHFLMEIDIDEHSLPSNVLFWSNAGWKQGDESLSTSENPRPAGISSFAVMDTILLRLAERNPNLQAIILAGHSAGGQFVNRYASGSQMEQTLSAEFGISFRYIIAHIAI